MGDCSGKRAVDGPVVPRKAPGHVLRETGNGRDQNAQFCNRIGCSGRLNLANGTQFGSSGKLKSLRPLLKSSSSGKEIVGTSSRASSAESSVRKPFRETRRKLSSQLDIDSPNTTCVRDEPEVSESVRIERGLHPDPKNTEDSESPSIEVRSSSSIASGTRTRRQFIKKPGVGNHYTLPGSSVSSTPKRTSQEGRNNTNASRYGLKNLRCNSLSDVLPSGYSSSDVSNNRKNVVKKRNSEGETSSSSIGKKMSDPSAEARRNSTPNHGISISDSRRARIWSSSGDDGIASVRNRRLINSNPRSRLSNQGNGNNSSQRRLSVMTPRITQPERPITANASSSSYRISAENHSRSPNSFSRPGSSSDSSHSRFSVTSSEVGLTRALMNRENFQHYNFDGIAEVLLALERIEQDEELSYEQLLVLESNLFLNGLSFHDQHRELRLDIDNMSYEELLALEERMGTVSTALPEEALTKCLKSSIYKPTPPEAGAMCVDRDDDDDDDDVNGDGVDDVKCSICQEEYVYGDEVGSLQCEHRYHVDCIQQWLRLKNWCPICKLSADPAQKSSAPS